MVWLLIWLLQPRYQSRQVNTALGFTTTTTNHQQPDTDTQHGLRFNTRDIQKYGFRVVLGYYYNDLGSPYLYVIFSVLVESCYTEASGQALTGEAEDHICYNSLLHNYYTCIIASIR